MARASAAVLLRSARTRAGLSQAELARRAGMPRSVVCLYESGRRQPTAENLVHLLDVAGFRLRLEPAAPGVDSFRVAARSAAAASVRGIR